MNLRKNLLFVMLAIFSGCGKSKAVATEFGVSGAAYVLPATDGPGAVYFTVNNPTAEADTIVGIASPSVRDLSMHETMTMGEGPLAVTHMMPVSRIPVPANGELRFSPGVNHVMASGPTGPLARGDSLVLTLRFSKHAAITATARVLTYADYDPRASPSKP